MKKRFLLDTNILMRTPNSIFVFEDNEVLIASTTIEELDDLKNKSGDTGYNARNAIRTLNDFRNKGENLFNGVKIGDHGLLKVVPDCRVEDLNSFSHRFPKEWSLGKPDNRIICTALKEDAILVTNDVSMMLKADIAGLKTESFKNDQVSDESLDYTGRMDIYTTKENVDRIYKEGKISVNCIDDEYVSKLINNQYIKLIDSSNASHTALCLYNGRDLECLISQKPCDVYPRNIGQKFAIDALMRPASEIPLVILKGSAGTAKTFLSLAAGLEQTMNNSIYNKMLLLRPNIKFDDDIGYLKGDEMDKILPLIRPCLDNLEALVANPSDSTERINDKIKELFDRGYVTAEALAYLRGRSIANTYILIDEAQNTTPNQMLGIITRAGEGSKIVVVGDPDQIDNPKIDKRNNGLVYAAEKMKGSKLCAQITFESDKECVRSPLSLEASKLL